VNDRIGRVEMLISIAGVIARRSTCSRLQVGAVLARDGRVLSTGYNGTPAGMRHCVHVDMRVPCVEAVHAEANAIAFAAKYGVMTDDTTMYITDSPCLKCAQLIINAGIKQVVYDQPYRDQSGVDLLKRAGLSCWSIQELMKAVEEANARRDESPNSTPGS